MDSEQPPIHEGPWFCYKCRGSIALKGFQDVTQDIGLIDYLWTGKLPESLDESERILRLSNLYRAHGKEL